MTQLEAETIKKLLKYAAVAEELEFVDLKTINYFNALREVHGLSRLLTLIYQYARTKVETKTPTPETSNPDQDQNVVQ